MTASQPKLRRYETVVRKIEDAMMAGEFAPGDRLPSERDLMERFKVGRGSVREALFALQQMGLVALSNGERAYVTRPTARELVKELSGAARQLLAAPEGVRHFQEARRLLECEVARDAARRANRERLQGVVAALEKCENATTAEAATAADVEFHLRIAEMAGNPVITALHAALGEWLREQRTATVHVEGAKPAADRAHRRIYDAIAARKPDAAARAMQAHLREVEVYYWRSVDGG